MCNFHTHAHTLLNVHAACAHTLADTHTACTIAITATVLPAFCIVCVLSNMYKRELKRQAQLSAFITPQLHTHTRTHTHSSTSDVSRLVGVTPRCCTVTPSFPRIPAALLHLSPFPNLAHTLRTFRALVVRPPASQPHILQTSAKHLLEAPVTTEGTICCVV